MGALTRWWLQRYTDRDRSIVRREQLSESASSWLARKDDPFCAIGSADVRAMPILQNELEFPVRNRLKFVDAVDIHNG